MNKLAIYFIVLFIVTPCHGEIYKWTDKNGNVLFSDKKQNKKSETVVVEEQKALNSAVKKIDKEKAELDSYLEYALRIRDKNPEYGTNIPKELCADNVSKPCKLPITLIQNSLASVDEAKLKLSKLAWFALRSHYDEGDTIWDFNLCRALWNESKPCVPVYGYLLIKNYSVSFFSFIADDENLSSTDTHDKESVGIKPEFNKNETHIISWEVTEQNDSHIILAVKYFYDGKYKEKQTWLSAHTLVNGSSSMKYGVRPSKIKNGTGIVNIWLGVSSDAPKRHCTNQIKFSIYGKDIPTFHEAISDFSKCWTNNHVKPTTSNPTRGIN